MAFKSWQGSRPYRPADGDTLAAIAEREAAAGNPITAEDIARFNWGTEDPDEIQTLMRDELGARARDADRGYVLSGDDRPRSELRIPESFEQRGFSLEHTHQVRVNRKDCPEQFLDCCSLPAITFDFDSSFVKPAVVDHLGAVETLVESHPDARLMVFGHTDAVGDEMYNKKLSERRAWAVHAFILNDPDAWETLYNHPDENWGLTVVQEILADLGHYQATIDGDMGPATRDAMRAFLGLDEDASVSNDADFRRELFAAYMGGKHDIEIEAERFMEPGFMGCGEFNLVEPTDSAEQKNRRVTFYAFHKDRLPNLPFAFADCGPCRNQMVTLENRHQEGFSCSFYDSWAKRCPCEGPPTKTYGLVLRVRVDLLRPELHDDVFTLESTNGAYRQQRTLCHDCEHEDDFFLEVRFDEMDDGHSYSLTVGSTSGGDAVTIFEDVPYSKLAGHHTEHCREPDYPEDMPDGP